MHDFSLTQHLLDAALEKANSRQIVRVNLLIGPFSNEREESIQFYWKDLAKGSRGQGAVLHFERIAVETKCLNCTGTSYVEGETSLCTFCGNEKLDVLHGEEVRLASIVVE